MMKTKFFKNFIWKLSIVLFGTLLCLGMLFVSPTFSTNAENFLGITVSDVSGLFSMRMTANSRRSNIALQKDERTVTQTTGKEVSFLCFKWRDLESLSFRFNGNLGSSNKTFTGIKFKLTYLQTEDLKQSFGTTLPVTLYETSISNNHFSQFDFHYYIDSNLFDRDTINSCKGNDFGLYKFDFSYDSFDPNMLDQSQTETVSIGSIYVAVLPDNIDEISSHQNIKIIYSISSSKKLMNVFNLTLSNNSFKFVNPEFLQWEASGMAIDNVNYCLTQEMKDSDFSYSNYKVLWDSLISTSGNDFVFDSNDIEGTWTVSCSIKNSDGQSEKMRLTVSDLSTIKTPQKSYLWLILLIIGLVLIASIAVALIFIIKNRKKEKVW